MRACPHCGLEYKDFRTGYTFSEIKNMLWVTSDDSTKWRYKRRNTILGKWHEIKQTLWTDHVELCSTKRQDSDTTETYTPVAY